MCHCPPSVYGQDCDQDFGPISIMKFRTQLLLSILEKKMDSATEIIVGMPDSYFSVNRLFCAISHIAQK